VIVRTEKGKPGIIKINASSQGLKATTIQVESKQFFIANELW
jgi:hypothetical protein